ncbi:hypothetical protein JXB02_01025 [Candidatus Woesearchaeota archaeon]|nr:hypothetical protein [Candidatus Woesearchaeota archaeon]
MSVSAGPAAERADPVLYFLRYSYPCAFVLLQQRRIDEDTYRLIRLAALGKGHLEKGFIEGIFSAAFRRLRMVAEGRGKDPWDLDVLQAYFRDGLHNACIDRGEGMYARFSEGFRDLCKVRHATVVARHADVLEVEYDGTRRRVVAEFVPDAKPGDRVTIHHTYAIEKLRKRPRS